MSSHLVYIHNGIIPNYLYDILEIARSYNKDISITLITDNKDCLSKLNIININYEYIDFFKSDDYKQLCNIYIHRCDFDNEKEMYKYEIFNFFRFIVLYNFIKKYNIEYVVYCDSALAILHNLKDKGCYLDLIKNNDLVLLSPISTYFSCWTFKTLENFIKYIYLLYQHEDDLNLVVENNHQIVRDKYYFSDMWLLQSFICCYPKNEKNIFKDVNEKIFVKYENNIRLNENRSKFIKLKNIESQKLNILFIGNIYNDFSELTLLKDNKYALTFSILINIYNKKYLLNFNEDIMFNLFCTHEINFNLIKEIDTIKDCINKDKQKIIYFDGPCKKFIKFLKKDIINTEYKLNLKKNNIIDLIYSIYNTKNLKLINKDNIVINNDYFNDQIYSLIYFNKDLNILELGAGEGIYSCTISTLLNDNLFSIEKDNIYIDTLYNNKNNNNLNFNIFNYDYTINDIKNNFNKKINSIIINRPNYIDYLITNLEYIIDDIEIILIKSDLLDYYNNFINIIKNNNFIIINTNYYNVFIKDKEKIINFNNSTCDYGFISTNNFTGVVNELSYNVHIINDISFENYNTIFAHSNCSIEIDIIKPIKISAFINSDIRHIINPFNNNIKFIVNDLLIDNLNSYNNITKEYILEKGIHNIKLKVDENKYRNEWCYTGFYWKYIDTKSQINQDINIIKFYDNKKNGFFIEIGASDGINFSNTYLLEKEYNYKGICVEPIPEHYKNLVINRPNSICCDKAVYSISDLILDFDIANNLDLLSGISICIDTFKESIDSNKTTIQVKTISLNDLLYTNNAPNFIEYLSLDTEGSEYEILKNFNFSNYIFGLIDVEHNYQEPRRSQIKDLLIKNGYIYIGENKWDDCYKHNSL
jgi:FkbM family methyltransferase